MKTARLSLLLCTLLLASCLDGRSVSPKKDDAKPVASVSAGSLCAATAKRLQAGHWDYSQRLYTSVKGVAADDGVTLPADFESAMKPYIEKNMVIDAPMRAKLVALFQAWGAK